jgi:hypothetical protein
MATLENVVTNFYSGAFTFTPGSRGVQEPQPPPSRGSWTDARSNGHRELGGTAANTPFVAWHHHDHGPVEGVDCGPWRAAVDGGPGRALVTFPPYLLLRPPYTSALNYFGMFVMTLHYGEHLNLVKVIVTQGAYC